MTDTQKKLQKVIKSFRPKCQESFCSNNKIIKKEVILIFN